MQKDEILDSLRAHWTEIAAFGVRSLFLFGSVARDEARPDSDVDLLVEFDPNAHIGLFEFVEIKEYLERLLGRPVDLVMPGALRERLRESIMKEAIRAA